MGAEDQLPEADLLRLRDQADQLRWRILGLQERFSYFFLAGSGSAIAFALDQSKGAAPGCWLAFVVAAVLLWGVSFVLSANHLLLKVRALLGDWQSIRIRVGEETRLESNPELKAPALSKLHTDMQANDRRSREHARRALYCFLGGAALYLVGWLLRVCCVAGCRP